jgi:twitching motility protein PilT
MAGLKALLQEMSEQEASDLILTAGTAPQLRIQGELRPVGREPLDAGQIRHLIDDILNDTQRKVFESTGSLDCSIGSDGLSRFRVHVYRQRGSASVAIRSIPFQVPGFEALGLPPVVKQFAALPHGLVLITGPAGSGKSTTLAAMIDHINHTRRAHVICIEDPIEYLHRHHRCTIDQREIPGDAPSFSEALKNVFRESPDVIMIGEMRDPETIRLTLTLAETGHLILGTLHTQDATHCISRVVDSFPPAQQHQIYVQLSMVLQGVIAQQLLPVSGGSRRILACEVMRPTNAIRNLIREQQVQQIYSAIQTGRSEGMVTMNDSLRQLCELGFIDEATALHRSPRPRELNRMLQRAIA